MGLSPALVNETMIREVDLRDPGRIRGLAQKHPSGLELLSVSPQTLGGRLYSGIYLFLNFLREVHDVVLISLGNDLGDVERSILAEADQVLLAGTDTGRPQYRQLESELYGLVEHKKIVPLWFGEPDIEDPSFKLAPGSQLIPWADDISDRFDRTGSPYEALDPNPHARRAIERLARKLGGVKIGLALGAGAALGHSLIGILKVFKKEGIPIDMISGTSVGSIVAGWTALGLEPEEIEEIALRVDKAWVYENFFWDLTVPRSGFFAGQTLLRFLRSYFGTREFFELEMPFACVSKTASGCCQSVINPGWVSVSISAA